MSHIKTKLLAASFTTVTAGAFLLPIAAEAGHRGP